MLRETLARSVEDINDPRPLRGLATLPSRSVFLLPLILLPGDLEDPGDPNGNVSRANQDLPARSFPPIHC